MSLDTIQMIIGTTCLMIAYVISSTLIGRAEAEVATAAGDETPEDMGFLSWDPLIFADLPGFICVLILGMGWSKQLPFNPHHVTGKHKLLKVFLVYMAKPFLSALLGFVAIFLSVVLLGADALESTSGGFYESTQGYLFLELAHKYNHASSFKLVLATVLLSIIIYTTFNTIWSLINNGFHYLLFIGHEHGHDYMQHAEALTFFGPLVMLVLFTGLLRIVILKYLCKAALLIAHFCGVVV
jgi:hypothetical protein